MDKEKDRLAQAYTDRETETAQFILIDTNMAINQGEDGDRRLFWRALEGKSGKKRPGNPLLPVLPVGIAKAPAER